MEFQKRILQLGKFIRRHTVIIILVYCVILEIRRAKIFGWFYIQMHQMGIEFSVGHYKLEKAVVTICQR